MKKVEILVFTDCLANPPVTSYEVLNMVEGLRLQRKGARASAALKVRLVACSRNSSRVVAAFGTPIQCHATLDQVRRPDLILVPALDGDVLQKLELNAEVVPWLRRQFQHGVDVASMCTGTFVLAEAGLLDGREATTHWASQDLFRRRYPKVTLKEQQIIVDQGRIITSGGAFSYLNLLMYLTEKFVGQELAVYASRMMLLDFNKSPQGTYAIFGSQKTHSDPAILKSQNLIENALSDEISVEKLADEVALSRRQFLRRFKFATGNTPVQYIQRVRVEAAKKALIRTRENMDEISWRVGYSDTPGFRKVFVRHTGLTPTEFRRRYNTTGIASIGA